MAGDLEQRVAVDKAPCGLRTLESIFEPGTDRQDVGLRVLQTGEVEFLLKREETAARRLDVAVEAVRTIDLYATEKDASWFRPLPA